MNNFCWISQSCLNFLVIFFFNFSLSNILCRGLHGSHGLSAWRVRKKESSRPVGPKAGSTSSIWTIFALLYVGVQTKYSKNIPPAVLGQGHWEQWPIFHGRPASPLLQRNVHSFGRNNIFTNIYYWPTSPINHLFLSCVVLLLLK